MENQGAEERRQERQQIGRDYPYAYPIIAGIGLVGIGVVLGYFLFTDHNGYLTDIFTEVLSIGVTILVLNVLAERRAQRELEVQLMRRIHSSVRDVAVAAVEELRHLGYFDLDKDTFKGVSLRRVQWSRVFLDQANLEGTDLEHARLQRARLRQANLQGAHLKYARLQGAHLEHARLQGAALKQANLQGVTLGGATFDEATVLPDKTYWTPDTYVRKFTDPDHPDFWRSDHPHSPAYRGDGELDGE